MIAGKIFMTHGLHFFYPTASATAYSQRPKFFMAEHSDTAEGENCAYGPTLTATIDCQTGQNKARQMLLQ